MSNDDATAITVTNIIRRLNTILDDESRKAAPHSCLLHAASIQIYIIIAKLALCSTSPELIAAATSFFHFLINGEVEGVLDSKIFARSLIDLVKQCIASATKVVNESEESSLIELLFEICTKIRLDPGILPVWFYPERALGPKAISPLEARRNQFPLFHLLIDYVHYDGSIGDFARMGLLYLTETAPKSPALEKWMMESNLAHQMASGLSALYGRLSRQTPSIKKSDLPILAFSDASEESSVVSLPDEDHARNMRGFLAYLQFWQDALSRCQSLEVRDTLLDSFQVLFVEQLLYPSLLESSDVEGGSTSAVILHLCSLLEAIEHSQLVNRMLSYLFATKSQPSSSRSQGSRHGMSMSRRKSVERLANLAQLTDNPSPDLFSLLDLLIFSLRSSRPETVSASLRLMTVLLRRNHPCVRNQLFSLERMPQQSRQNLNHLNHTMMTLFDLASAISQVNSMDQSYQAALQDAQSGMERHSCLLDESVRTSLDLGVWIVSKDCKSMEQMRTLLSTWFSNDTLVNLELTGVFNNISFCEYVLMRSWLVPTEDPDETPAAKPVGVIAIIGQLVEQIKNWRSKFVEWDTFYSIQRVEIASENELLSLGQPKLPTSPEGSRPPTETTTMSGPSLPGGTGRSRVTSEAAPTSNRVAPRMDNEDASIPAQSSGSGMLSPGADTVGPENVPLGGLSATLLETRIPVRTPINHSASRGTQILEAGGNAVSLDDSSKTRSPDDAEDRTEVEDTGDSPTATLRHLLTQAIILQEFILELAAVLQIRATLFDEVDLS